MPERKKVCDNCRFLAGDNRCHRRAPAADDHGTPMFPIIRWSDHQWCGDWEPYVSLPCETSVVPARQYLVMERELHNLAAVTNRYFREIRLSTPGVADLISAAEKEVEDILLQLPPDPRQKVKSGDSLSGIPPVDDSPF